MKRQWICILTFAALLCGCAVTPQPFDYHDDREEKPGPGLFSGDRGGYTVYGESSDQTSDRKADEEEKASDASPVN